MRSIIVLAIAVLVTACAIKHQPLPEGYSGPTAMIIDTMDPVSSTRVFFFQLLNIDEREVLPSSVKTASASAGQGFVMNRHVQSHVVPAGEAILMLEAKTHVAAPILALGGGMYKVQGEVSVTLEEDVGYYVRGHLSKDYSAVWLEDFSGRIVSEKIEVGDPPADLALL